MIEKSRKCPVLIKDANDNQTMGDIYDTVNENLLRYSAENQKDITACSNKWQKDFYYFIVDTNVLLKDLTFVEDLTKMKLCGKLDINNVLQVNFDLLILQIPKVVCYTYRMLCYKNWINLKCDLVCRKVLKL